MLGARRHRLDASETADEIVATIVAAGAELDVEPGAAWGIAMPDPFDYDHGIALFRDVGKFDALYGVDIDGALRDALPQQPSTCVFRNDADLFVLGEWTSGAAEGAHRCVGVTLGTGLGTGWLVDGHIVVDEPGVPELGRARTILLDEESLEESVSTRGIKRAYVRHGGHDADVAEIARRAYDGEGAARSAFATAGAALGRGLARPLREFRPDVVVLGGSIAKSWSLIEPSFRDGIDWAHAPPVALAHHPDDAALRGAARATVSERR